MPRCKENKRSHIALGCSPRRNGNSDAALNTWTEVYHIATPLQLRETNILPCVGCGACAEGITSNLSDEGTLFKKKDLFLPFFSDVENKNAEGIPQINCPLLLKDNSLQPISAIYSASSLCIVSPIYFYFFPSHVKSLIDRLQPFWEKSIAGKNSPLTKRRCYTILISGRAKGEKLFEGSLLSLKYALSPLGYTLENPLLLRGYDNKNDLASDEEALQKVRDYAFYALDRESG